MSESTHFTGDQNPSSTQTDYEWPECDPKERRPEAYYYNFLPAGAEEYEEVEAIPVPKIKKGKINISSYGAIGLTMNDNSQFIFDACSKSK
jgi:hypothetical protein